MQEDKLTKLYNLSEAMTEAGSQVKEGFKNEYQTIIEYVKWRDTKVRIMAAQLIARFFKHFPEFEEIAFDAIVDLCESPNVDVRKHATMVMMTICRDCKHLVSKAADILIQLYQTDQASEVNLINQSLTTLLNLNVRDFLQSFFTNFEDGGETVRERSLKFLTNKIHTLSEDILTKEIEEQLLTYAKKVMEDVTKDEFISFITILTKLKIAKTAAGQAMIVAVIKSKAELDKDFEVSDTDSLDKFFLCAKHTIPLLSQYQRGSEYVNYICLKVLPHLKALSSSGNDLNFLEYLAKMSAHVSKADSPELINLDECQKAVYDKLMEYLPLPQADDAVIAAPAAGEANEIAEPVATETPIAETTTEENKSKEPDFQFTHIEYLIYAFHQFGRLNPEFYDEARQNESKIRLGHCHIGCTKFKNILEAQLRRVKSEDLKKEENRLRSIALRTTKNISVIVKDLLMKPPHFKASVVLSCKPLAEKSEPTVTTSSAEKTKGRFNYQAQKNKRRFIRR